MEPLWNEFHKESGADLNIGQVDCKSEFGAHICEEYKLEKVPSTLFFPPKGNEAFCEYSFDRDVERW